MAHQPCKLIQHREHNSQLNAGNSLQNKSIPDATSVELKISQSNVCIASLRRNKTNLKLNTKTKLPSTDTFKPNGMKCNEQFIRKKGIDSRITRQHKNSQNRDSVVNKLQSCSTRIQNQPVNEEAETPRLVMASVGKRNAKKREFDDFIRYDLTTKKTKINNKSAKSTKTGREVKQRAIVDKSLKKPAKNPSTKCTTKINNSEAAAKLEACSLGEEQKKGQNFPSAGMKILDVCRSTGHRYNISNSMNAAEKGADMNKNTNIRPGHSAKSSISTQLKIRNVKPTTSLRCVTCRIFFNWKMPFLNHLKVHPNDSPFECIQCRKRFVSFFSYMTHIHNYHRSGKAYCCRKCGKRHPSLYLLLLHWIKHRNCHSAPKYLCSICDAPFPYKYFLSRHLVNSHNTTTEEASDSLSCKPCGKSFKHRRNLWIHKKRHKNATKPHKCHLCDRSFAMHKWLMDHVQRHVPERNYSCGVCSKCYFTKTDAAMHERRHTKEAHFVCSECDKRFIYRSELKAHSRRHQGIRLPKNIVCDVCSKAFYTRRDLERHSTVHTGEKPYKCNVCSKCFSQEVNMQVHAKIHSGDRPYQCDLCDKKFLARSKLTRHRRCHTTSKGMLLRPFKCVLCPRKYTTENSLIRHLRTHRDSLDIVTNIKSALKKASEESSAAQSTAGAVLACMIDQAILDARRMAHSRKSNGTKGDPSLSEIIDQAIHDSKTTSSPQTPKTVETCSTTHIHRQLSPSSASINTEHSKEATKETNISESFADLSTHSCSDIIKLISDVLSKHIGTNHKIGTTESVLYQSSPSGDPSAQPVVAEQRNTVFTSDQFVWISKHESQNLLQNVPEVTTSVPHRSILETSTAPNDTISANSASQISLGVCDDQHVFVNSLSAATDIHSFQNNILILPVNGPNLAGSHQQVIFLDAFSGSSDMLHSSPSSSYNHCHQQNILAVNGKSSLMMVPVSAGKDLRAPSPQSSVTNIHQFKMPRDFTKKGQLDQTPTNTGQKCHSVSLNSTNS